MYIMPVLDIDGGLNFQGYNPRILTDKLPKEQYLSNRFYFAGSEVPLNLNRMSLSSHKMSKNPSMKVLKKLAGRR